MYNASEISIFRVCRT